MNIIKSRMLLFFLFVIGYAISEEIILKNGDGTPKYTFNMSKSESTLTIGFNGKTYQYKDVIGIEGQVYKNFVIFNNQPALWYSSITSKNNYDIYYTLILKNNGVFIDCAYANISFSDYNMVINRAVCGLNTELNADYSDLIYSFANKWEDDISSQIRSLKVSSGDSLLLGKIDDISILINYNINKELDSDIADITFSLKHKKYKPLHKKIYLVSFTNAPDKLVELDEVIDKEEKKSFIKKDITDIKKNLTSNNH